MSTCACGSTDPDNCYTSDPRAPCAFPAPSHEEREGKRVAAENAKIFRDTLDTPSPSHEERAREVDAAYKALDMAAGLIAELFRYGVAHTGEGFGYYIGEGFLPTIVAARDNLAALASTEAPLRKRIEELERRVWEAEADAKVHIEFTANSDRRAEKAEAENARLRKALAKIAMGGLGLFNYLKFPQIAKAALKKDQK